MNFFTNFMDKVKEKKADLDDRREFLKMVDEEAKPIKRRSYMAQMLKEAVNEGIAIAKLDAEKRLPKKKKKPEDFGINKEKGQWDFLDKIGITEQNRKGPELSIPKINPTKLDKKKK